MPQELVDPYYLCFSIIYNFTNFVHFLSYYFVLYLFNCLEYVVQTYMSRLRICYGQLKAVQRTENKNRPPKTANSASLFDSFLPASTALKNLSKFTKSDPLYVLDARDAASAGRDLGTHFRLLVSNRTRLAECAQVLQTLSTHRF